MAHPSLSTSPALLSATLTAILVIFTSTAFCLRPYISTLAAIIGSMAQDTNILDTMMMMMNQIYIPREARDSR